jgi:hypothetical protein
MLCMALRRSSLVLLVAPLVASMAKQQGPLPDLQPRTYTSPSGRWALSIDPSQRDGSGPGRYRCTQDGKEAWSGEKPWSFYEACITDEGVSAGYSYSQGGLEQFAGGEFHVVILSPDGSVRLDESHNREPSHFMHMPPDPCGCGVFHQPDLGRIVFRLSDPDINRRSEEWWSFTLPDVKDAVRKRPRDELPSGDPRDIVVAVRGVPGTAFTLVEWRMFAWPKIGLQFTLHDANLKPVWDLTRPEELTGPDNQDTDELVRAVYESGTLLDEPGAARFAIGLPKSRERIRFAIEGTGSTLSVREIDRQPWSIKGKSEHPARFEDLPATQLKSRGTFDVGLGQPDPTGIRDIETFDFGPEQVLRLVRREKDRSHSLLRVDGAGHVLDEHHLDLSGLLPEIGPRFWSLGQSEWLVTQSPSGEGAKARAWQIDEATGTARQMADFDCPSIEGVAALESGRFVVLATERRKYTSEKTLRMFNADGQTLWKHEGNGDPQQPSSLFSPEAIATTTDGLVAVVDVIRHTLQVFGPDGTFHTHVDLESAWGREPRYPSTVRADVNGDVVIDDFEGNPPLYRMSIDGNVRAALTPHFPDGKTTTGLARNVRVAPDGRLWTTDGQRLLRMDDHGLVDLQFGALADANVLGEPSASAIDVFGRVLVQDAATGAVHVFDGKGGKLFVCRPEPTDFKDPDSIAHLAATRERGVIAQTGMRGFIRFGPDGARQDNLKVGLGSGSLVFSPVSDLAYCDEFGKGFVQLDAALGPGATFNRMPDGSWLEARDGPAVAPDGAVAVVASGAGIDRRGGRALLVLFETADPKAARVIDLPEETPSYCLALGRKWTAISGYGKDVLLVHRSDGRCIRFSVPDAGTVGNSWRFGFDPETNDLIALDATARKLRRFELP